MAVEIKAALETGVLKNHRNDAFTRLARNTARTNHAYKKARETHQQKKAINVVDNELASLKNSQKENAMKIKELKAAKSKIAGKRKPSKAESNSSSKVVANRVSKRKRADSEVASESGLPLEVEPLAEANYYRSASSSSSAGPSSYHFPTESTTTYSMQPPLPVPLAEMTAMANLFPQEHGSEHLSQAPASSSLDSDLLMPPAYDAPPPTPNSGLGFFAIADSELALAANDDSDPILTQNVTEKIDYHSSDDIFDQFSATFGSLSQYFNFTSYQ